MEVWVDGYNRTERYFFLNLALIQEQVIAQLLSSEIDSDQISDGERTN